MLASIFRWSLRSSLLNRIINYIIIIFLIFNNFSIIKTKSRRKTKFLSLYTFASLVVCEKNVINNCYTRFLKGLSLQKLLIIKTTRQLLDIINLTREELVYITYLRLLKVNPPDATLIKLLSKENVNR